MSDGFDDRPTVHVTSGGQGGVGRTASAPPMTALARSLDAMIGRLDRLLSEFLLAAASQLDEADRQTIKHHADDLVGVGEAALKRLGISPTHRRGESPWRLGVEDCLRAIRSKLAVLPDHQHKAYRTALAECENAIAAILANNGPLTSRVDG